ncbi:hypothetical protein GEMRC1_013619 [Eukaryota sp. GEM-RC1]
MQNDNHYLLDDPPQKKRSYIPVIIAIAVVIVAAIVVVAFLLLGQSNDQVLYYSFDTSDGDTVDASCVANLDTNVILMSVTNGTSNASPVPLLLIDGESHQFWTIGHDICSVSPPFGSPWTFLCQRVTPH